MVATAADGNYLITWSSNGQDGSSKGVYGQLYASDNSKIGNEIAVNSVTASQQTHPDADFFADGSFIVTWQTNDSSNTGIAGQIFSADGAKVGSEIAINATTSQAQRVPSVEVLSDDTALITWSSYGQSGNAYDIIGRLLSKEGVFPGDEFQINLNTSGNECESDVIELSNGNILVAYNDYSGLFGVYGQIISPTGTAIGSEINIDGGNSSIPTNGIDIAALVGGGFVATWRFWETSSETKVFAQVFDSSGTAVSTKKTLSSSDIISFPSVAAHKDGGFMVSWSATGGDGTGANVYAQSFSAAGDSLGEKFLINSTTAGDQKVSDIEFAENGDLIAAWISNGQDGDGNGIFAQRFSTGTSSAGLTINSSTNALTAITAIDTAIKTVNTQRSSLGAISNRLSHTVNNLTNISANLSTAKGVIEDADFAHETSNLAKNQILQQASTAMLAQANASKQNVLTLLQG